MGRSALNQIVENSDGSLRLGLSAESMDPRGSKRIERGGPDELRKSANAHEVAAATFSGASRKRVNGLQFSRSNEVTGHSRSAPCFCSLVRDLRY